MPASNHSFHAAAEDGDIHALYGFLTRGEPVDAPDPEGRTPLMYAIHGVQIVAVRHLLKWGASIKDQTPRGVTPLFVAAFSGNSELVRLLLAHGADPAAAVNNSSSCSLLMSAILSENVETVRILLEAGVDKTPPELTPIPGLREPGKKTDILAIAIQRGSLDMVRLLVEHGFDPIAVTEDSNLTPLIYAISSGLTDIARFILDAGAELNKGGNYSVPNCGMRSFPWKRACRHSSMGMFCFLQVAV